MQTTTRQIRRARAPHRRAHRELIELRLNEGLSRIELGRRCGVSHETIRLAELGYTPGPRVQFAVAQVFGKRPLELWPFERQRVVA